jgi:toxin ParE1/3/4
MPGKKSRRVNWAPAADNDLRSVFRYYAREASPATADRMVRDIMQTGAHLAHRATTWRKRDDVAPGLRSVLCHPYVIFYRVDDTSVEIVRVLHEQRDFNAIFGKKKQ